MSERCYTLQLTEDPQDVVVVRLDISEGEPTEEDIEELREFFLAIKRFNENEEGSNADSDSS